MFLLVHTRRMRRQHSWSRAAFRPSFRFTASLLCTLCPGTITRAQSPRARMLRVKFVIVHARIMRGKHSPSRRASYCRVTLRVRQSCRQSSRALSLLLLLTRTSVPVDLRRRCPRVRRAAVTARATQRIWSG